MTMRSQKRKTVVELVFGEFEASVAENNSFENLVAGPSKTLRNEPENFDDVKRPYLWKIIVFTPS